LAVAVIALPQTLFGFVLEFSAQQTAGIIGDTAQPLFQGLLFLITLLFI
jgi:hypothetical protein